MKSFAPSFKLPLLLLALAAAPGLTAAGVHTFDPQLYQDLEQMRQPGHAVWPRPPVRFQSFAAAR